MKDKSPPPSPSCKASTDPSVLRATAKALCEQDHLFFSRYFFKHRQAIKFRVNWHHELIAQKVQDVIDGRIKNLVINVPPGSSKTELRFQKGDKDVYRLAVVPQRRIRCCRGRRTDNAGDPYEQPQHRGPGK